MHINKIIAFADSIKERLRRCIDATNTLPEQQRAYKEMLNWVGKERSK